MPPPATPAQESVAPLCVDLDGTLIKTDLVWESLVRLIKRNPIFVLIVPFWLLRGRAYLKRQISQRVSVDAASLPYNQPFLEFLRAERGNGRKIYLVTACDSRLAQDVADHLGIFSELLGSDGKTNLRGKTKAAALVERFGRGGFDYAGNSTVDLPVWEQARQAIVVSPNSRLAARAEERTKVARRFDSPPPTLGALARALRPHQWVKNLIVFVPLLTSHRLMQPAPALDALRAFVAFCLCASAVYVLNDLLDVEADRHHPTKRLRPFACGDLALPLGLALVPILFLAAAAVAWLLPWRFGLVLGIYFGLTTSYSWRLKEAALLDVFCLAGLYTIRLIGGHEAAGVEYSFWLLVFSMFIFLSLALVKRFVELRAARQQSKSEIKGRGYSAGDLDLVATLGCANGYLAVLVLALYVNSDRVVPLYHHPMRLLLVCPLLLYWISRTWLIAHRGQMHEDPIVFALKDPVSYLVGALTLLVVWLAT
jgi:4-hydroxybenzoate polyprenyltransferase/phosphoserine phosphatase